MSDQMLIRHCAPTLAGLKTGNLFGAFFASEQEMRDWVRSINRRLQSKGLRALPLQYKNGRGLIYLFRPCKLQQDLQDPTACALLQRFGYAPEKPNCCVMQLMKRLAQSEEFPHEIGLFLGYPPKDVLGFLEQRPEDCKCVGCWRVYNDEEQAKKTFARFHKCTKVYHKHWAAGRSVERLTVSA